jgi:hypothetical protein
MGRPKKTKKSNADSAEKTEKVAQKNDEHTIEDSVRELVKNSEIVPFCATCHVIVDLPENFMTEDIVCSYCKAKLGFNEVIFKNRDSFIKC